LEKIKTMRIALFPDEYLPEGTRVHAKMIHELALELKRLGHHPIVITPGIPTQKRLVINLLEGIEVWRFRSQPTRGVGRIKRAINETFLPFKAWLAIRKKVKNNPFDFYINYSPTIFFGPLIKYLKYKTGGVSYLILRDMFPQWAIDQGLLKEKSIITSYFRWFEKINYKSSDFIGVMSEANKKLFKLQYSDFNNVKILYNWSNTKPYSKNNVPDTNNIRKSLNLKNKVIFFYGGNIGHAQDMTNLINLVYFMKKYPNAHFLFVGQGDEVNLVLEKKEQLNLNNLTYLSSVSQEKYKQILTQVDIGLFSLSKHHSAHNFPGKLLGYMLQSLPILGSVNFGNDLTHFINDNEAGYTYINGENELLFEAAVILLMNPQLRIQNGKNANTVLHRYFSVNSAAINLLTQYSSHSNAKLLTKKKNEQN